jgi:hypothetical protein
VDKRSQMIGNSEVEGGYQAKKPRRRWPEGPSR